MRVGSSTKIAMLKFKRGFSHCGSPCLFQRKTADWSHSTSALHRTQNATSFTAACGMCKQKVVGIDLGLRVCVLEMCLLFQGFVVSTTENPPFGFLYVSIWRLVPMTACALIITAGGCVTARFLQGQVSILTACICYHFDVSQTCCTICAMVKTDPFTWG